MKSARKRKKVSTTKSYMLINLYIINFNTKTVILLFLFVSVSKSSFYFSQETEVQKEPNGSQISSEGKILHSKRDKCKRVSYVYRYIDMGLCIHDIIILKEGVGSVT